MISGLLSDLLFGSRDSIERRKFAGFATAGVVAVIVISSVVVRPYWLKSSGVAVSIGLLVTVGAVAGIRGHGLVFAEVPSYVFSFWMVHRNILMNTSGPELILRKALVGVILPLVLSVPPVVVGYTVGFGLNKLNERRNLKSVAQ